MLADLDKPDPILSIIAFTVFAVVAFIGIRIGNALSQLRGPVFTDAAQRAKDILLDLGYAQHDAQRRVEAALQQVPEGDFEKLLEVALQHVD